MNPFNRKKVLVVSPATLGSNVQLLHERWDQILPYKMDAGNTDFSGYSILFLDMTKYPDTRREGHNLHIDAVELYESNRYKLCVVTDRPLDEEQRKTLLEKKIESVVFPITQDKVNALATERSMD